MEAAIKLYDPYGRQLAAPRRDELGVTGTQVSMGKVSGDEYNADLLDRTARLTEFDKMRRSDAQVKASLLAVTLPIRGAAWEVVPGSNDKADLRVAQLVRSNLFGGMSNTFDDFLRQSFIYLWAGFMVFEKVYERRNNFWALRKLAPRLPKSIHQWNVARDGGLKSVTQRAYIPGGKDTPGMIEDFDIPVGKLIVFVNEKEGANWDGISVLRSAYKHWRIKDLLYRLDATAHERFAVGTPVGTLKQGYVKKDKEDLIEILEALRAHEKAYIVKSDVADIEILWPDGSKTGIMESIKHHNEEISKNVFAQFINLGSSETGARSLGDMMQDFFLLTLEATVKSWIATVNAYVIRQLVDFNFGTVTEYPTLHASKLERIAPGALADSLLKLAQAGLISPDGQLEAYIRSKLGLPEKLKGATVTRLDPRRPSVSTLDDGGVRGKLIYLEDYKRARELEHRDFRPYEVLLAIEEINSTLEKAERRFVNTVTPVVHSEVDKIGDFLKAHGDEIDAAPKIKVKRRGTLIDRIKRVLMTVFDFGRQQVVEELESQRKDPELHKRIIAARKQGDRALAPIKGRTKDGTPKRKRQDLPEGEFTDWLDAKAQVVADLIANRIEQGAAQAALDVSGGRITASAAERLTRQVADEIVGLTARSSVQEAFGLGREKESGLQDDQIEMAIRTAILDSRLCEHCADLDDREYPPDDPEMVHLPDAECFGAYKWQGACRCLYVYVLKQEAGGR